MKVKVKMRTTTSWERKLRKPGEILTVDETVAKRWERNGLAVVLDEKKGKNDQDPPADGLENQTVDELRKLAEEKGIAPGNMKKDDLIAAIRG